MIIGITGRKRAGKDSVASVLIEEAGFQRVGFSDSLKALALLVNPIVDVESFTPEGDEWGDYSYPIGVRYASLVEEIGLERAKEEPEVRRILQHLGTDIRTVLGEDVWVNNWYERVDGLVPDHGDREDLKVVVPDVRFINEANEIRRCGGVIWRVERPDPFDLLPPDLHVSETEMDGITPDFTFYNDGTLGGLQAAVRHVLTTEYAPSEGEAA